MVFSICSCFRAGMLSFIYLQIILIQIYKDRARKSLDKPFQYHIIEAIREMRSLFRNVAILVTNL